jgi:hypothetical protein
MKKFLWSPSTGTFVIAILMSVATLLNGCKENTILPPDMVPPVDNINTFQDLSQQVITDNIYQDSIITGGVSKSSRVSSASTFYHGLGTIELDPIFGKTTASFHVEVIPGSANFQFKSQYTGTHRTIDSVVLSIPYVTSFGDTLHPSQQTFSVYRSLKTFSRDSTQYEFTQDVVDYSRPLGSQTVNFQTFRSDSPYVGTAKAAPQLRFKLNQWFIDSLEAQVDSATKGAAASFSQYLEWWKGFSVQPEANNGSTIGYFSTYNTRMYIYYRYTNTDNLADTAVDVFSFDPSYCNRFNTITRNYSGTPIEPILTNQPVNGDSVLFIQNEPGMAAVLRFPTLASLDNRIVNKAELIFTAVSPYMFDFNTIYGVVPRMQIFKTDDTGLDAIPSDYNSLGSTYVNGSKSELVKNGQTYTQYKFNLTQTFQKVISQKDTTFRLKIMGLNVGLPGAYRVMLRGSGSDATEFKPTLNLIYTKLDK